MTERYEVSVRQQLADIAALKRVGERRQGLVRHSPEWDAAVEEERSLIERIRRWTRPGRWRS